MIITFVIGNVNLMASYISLILTKLFLHEILLLIFKISDQAVFFDILILDIW